MLYLNKLLYCIKKHPNLFTLSNVCFVTGLIKNQLTVLRHFATSNGLICAADKRKHYILTELGEKYLACNPLIKNNSLPDTNLEYLKVEKTPAIVIRAIRQLAKHMIDNEEIKQDSVENYIKCEILAEGSKFAKATAEIEDFILSSDNIIKSVKIDDIYQKFTSSKLTRSIISVILLYILTKHKQFLAIYELGEYQLKLTPLIFDRMIHVAKNFEIKLKNF